MSAFQRDEKTRAAFWKLIPDETEILVTHGPPQGHGDELSSKKGIHVGCPSLREEVLNRIKPIVHIFGHIHEAHGVSLEEGVTFINASICDRAYKPK